MEYTLGNLEVYHLAEEFSDDIWNIVIKWGSFEKNGIGRQLTSAADSISENIAESYGRFFYAESRQLYFYSRSSPQESKSWLSKCKRRKSIEDIIVNTLLEKGDTLLFKRNAYTRFVSNSPRHNAEKKAKPN